VVPNLIGWILVATARHITQLYVARFIFGLSISIPYTIIPMYCGEIAEVNLLCMHVQVIQRYLYVDLSKIFSVSHLKYNKFLIWYLI